MDDLITVIIPVYNVERYLERCMNSVLNQTYNNLEIILINDKSTDQSGELCLTYLKDKRVTLIEHTINKGLSGARNTGLEAAHGKYIMFVDSDDYIEFDMIENLYNCIIETGADTVIGGFQRIIGKKKEIYKNPFSGIVYDNTEDIKNKVLKKMLASNGIDQIEMSVWKVLFSANIIKTNHLQFPDRKYLCEDIIFDFDYYPLSQKIAMCNDTGYCYCLNDGSLSQAYQKNKFERISFQTDEMKKRSLDMDFDEDAFIRIDNFYIGNLIHHMKTMAANTKKIGKECCISEFKTICNSYQVKKSRWHQIKKCFKGRDKIPFYLMKWGKVYILYMYLCFLTNVRAIVRK